MGDALRKMKRMEKSIWIMTLMISLYACSDHSPVDNENSKKEAPKSVETGLTFKEMPNENTTYITIETNSIDENEALLLALQTRLLKANFEFIEKDSVTSWSENDCNLNKIVQVKGEGIRSYTAISNEKIGEDKKVRPDFVMLVFGFENEQIAEKNFQIISSVVHSAGGYCNGKSPESIVRNGKEVFYFTTRAEMFRTYVDEYTKFIRDFKNE
jgi:hypothetical protein